jgi:hypothetical protein
MAVHKRQPWGTEKPSDAQVRSFTIHSNAPMATHNHG